MAQSVFYVVPHGAKWAIEYHGDRYGPFTSEQGAIYQAIDWAQDHGKQGNEASVLVKGTTTKWRKKWVFGRDAYPRPDRASLRRG